MTKAKTQPNLLEGPLWGKIIRFSIPLILANLLQALYNTVDLMIVGVSDVAGAVGAIGTTTPLNSLFLNLCIGFSIGTNVVVARNIGSRERGKTQRAVHSSVLVGLLFGLVTCLLGQLLCPWVLRIMGAEGAVYSLALLYARLYFLGLPFMSLTNVLAAVFRAKGDTKTPLIVLSLTGFFKICVSAVFIVLCHMDVDGAALSTIFANVASAAILFVLLMKDSSWCRICLRKLRLDKQAVRETLWVGIPAGLSSAMFYLSNMQVQSAVIQVNNTMYPGGSAVVDGHAASYSMEGLIYTCANAVAQAATTFTSQHLGAGKIKRIESVVGKCYLLAFLISGIGGVLVWLFSDLVMSLFVSEQGALDAAYIRNSIMLSTYGLVGCMEVGTAVLRGLGKPMTSTIISVLGICALRGAWVAFLFPLQSTLECVYSSYPASWIVTGVVSLVFVIAVWKKLLKRKPA